MWATVVLGICASYLYIQWKLSAAWQEHIVPPFDNQTSYKASVSILVPIRNEAFHLEALINDLLAQDYKGSIEIIFLDDHSDDDTAAIIKPYCSLNVLYVSLAESSISGKKAALSHGVAIAEHDIIVTTDGDCRLPSTWLSRLVQPFKSDVVQMVSAPVLMYFKKDWLTNFQVLDTLGMMGVTYAASHLHWFGMANGANLAYRKAFFRKEDGFEGSMNFASGDDMTLAQKAFVSDPSSLVILQDKSSTVHTFPMLTWSLLFQQRLRWGTKNSATHQPALKRVAAIALLMSWYLMLGWVSIFLSYQAFLMYLFAWTIKFIGDAWLQWPLINYYYPNPKDQPNFMKAWVIHPFYFGLVGLASIFYKEYTWKGRVQR